MNKKIIKLFPIFVLGIITIFSLSACSQKVKEQSTQDILMSKTWDEADNKGTVNWQGKFLKSQVKTTEGNDSWMTDYTIKKLKNKEIISLKNEGEFEIRKNKNGFKFIPTEGSVKEKEERAYTLTPHQ